MFLKHFHASIQNIFFSVISSHIHRTDGCFQDGECRESIHLGGLEVRDEYACLDACADDPECKWTTFYGGTGYCQMFSDCTILDNVYCSDCLTASRGCKVEEPICIVSGECVGLVHHAEPTLSVEECLSICNKTVS